MNDSVSKNLKWVSLPESYGWCSDNHSFVPATSNREIQGGEKIQQGDLALHVIHRPEPSEVCLLIVGQHVHTH